MSLRIISGRAGTGKTTKIHREIIDDLQDHPLGPPIFIIVPDQMSFTTEYELTNKYDVQGIMRAQVMTFKRLAWYVLQETGGIARDKLDSVGYRMLIRRVLEEHKEEFQLFRQAAGKRGFTKEIERLLKEFNQYNVTGETIGPIIDELQATKASNTLLAKMKDLQIIVEELEARVGNSYVDGEGFYPVLIEQLPNAESLHGAQVYLDGFTSFTMREFEIVKQLLSLTKRVTIILPFEGEQDAFDAGAIFHRGAQTYEKLLTFTREFGIEVEEREHLEQNFRFEKDDIHHVERYFNAPIIERKQADGHVQIIEGANRRAEVQGIAREIRRLVEEEGLRYNNIGVMYRQADVYDPIIFTTFEQYGIPLFSNEKRPMLHHPLIEFSRSVLEAVLTNWQYETVFRSIKTDLFFPLKANKVAMREKMDQLENFVIAKGIIGNRWHDDNVWFYKKMRSFENVTKIQTTAELAMQTYLTSARDLVRNPLLALDKKLKKAKNGKDIAVALYEFMEGLSIYDKLVQLKDLELEKGELDYASEHEQAWNGWVNVLEQFVLMFGEQDISVEDAAQILDEGFESLQFSNIPPSIDEVTVSTVEFARFDNMKVVFIIGVNDGIYPMRMDNEGIISDAERESFEAIQYELSPSSKNRLLQESFLIYRAFSSPKYRLYVTYPSADEESKGLLPSLYINRLHKLFEVNGKRTLPHTRIFIDPIEEMDAAKVLSYLRHPAPALGFLMMQLKRAETAQDVADEWLALKAYYEQDAEWQRVLEVVMKPLLQKNEAEPLREEITQQLYGEELRASVSRIEKFYSCAFSHFSAYGLRLNERSEYRLETFAMGDLFHEALRQILSETEPQAFKTYSQCLAKARQTVESLVSIFSYRILESNARYTYIKEKLIRIVGRTLFALNAHDTKSKFKPLVHEKPFGMTDAKNIDEAQQKSLKALEIKLKNERKMLLSGQIDRIDGYKEGSNYFMRVVDYKSSGRQLDLNEVYYGISLQLLTYLDVALRNAKDLIPNMAEIENLIAKSAGVLYVHVHDPLLTLEDYGNEVLREQTRLENYRMTGLLTNETNVLQAMDDELNPQVKSAIIPVELKKDGSPNAHSKVVDEQEMDVLQRFVHRKLEDAGNEIYAGTTAINPFSLRTKNACTFCSFKSVCQFDLTESDQQYNQLKPAKSADILGTIKKELNVDDTD
ncbi:helicase-exonuclease AddAB subunit AddB [Solibacillus sp. FSL H8-0538]|uniref:helicase-exonuclease AddAB subunit AddB n=1 Tax=Solibacillus sp. FSL H8-0538 TaxID=2921400 RepID=UPI0030F59C63